MPLLGAKRKLMALKVGDHRASDHKCVIRVYLRRLKLKA